ELGAVAAERLQAGALVPGAIEGEKGLVVPIDEFRQGVVGLARREGDPSRPLPLRPGEGDLHRLVDEEMGGMPVFAAAAVRDDEIGALERRAALLREMGGRDVGSEDLVAFPLGVDVSEKDELVDAEDVAGLAHFLRADAPQLLAG